MNSPSISIETANSILIVSDDSPGNSEEFIIHRSEFLTEAIAIEDQFSDSSSSVDPGLIAAILKAQDVLKNFAAKTSFLENLYQIFGTELSVTTALDLQNQWLNTDFDNIPKVEVRTREELQGAFGAYANSTNKIYINQEFLGSAPQNQIVAVLLEEIGHSIDAQLNRQDTPGDEGEVFAELVRGNTLSSSQLANLQTQNDTIDLNLDGVLVPVETSSLIGEEIAVDVRFSTFADSFVDVSLFSTTFTVGAGQEVTNQSVSTTFSGGGFPQTLSGNVSIDVGSDTIFTRFNGIAQGGSISFIFSSLVGDPVQGIGSATETGSSGIINGVHSTLTPSVSNDVVTTGFRPLGFQPGTNITQTVQIGFSVPNQVPSFNDGTTTTLTLNEDSAATSINNLLDITDADSGNALTWSVSSPPSNGSLGGFNG
ncbi:MAG: hypothetical protein F6K42_22090, partial [Leptolyngbya sp. SIO1D8]|nr:hypothetical protein [Leptolyngbya sp. SIO1D8]